MIFLFLFGYNLKVQDQPYLSVKSDLRLIRSGPFNRSPFNTYVFFVNFMTCLFQSSSKVIEVTEPNNLSPLQLLPEF